MLNMKLKWRVGVVTLLGAVTLIFFTLSALMHGHSESIKDKGEQLYRQGGSHLVAARSLVDKSSWAMSNYSSPEHQFADEPPPGQKVSYHKHTF